MQRGNLYCELIKHYSGAESSLYVPYCFDVAVFNIGSSVSAPSKTNFIEFETKAVGIILGCLCLLLPFTNQLKKVCAMSKLTTYDLNLGL
jgi:hypothetical protein